MWRKIAELGLTPIYHSDKAIARLLQIVQFLAFVPVDHVILLFDEIKMKWQDQIAEHSAVTAFYDYYEANYVGTSTIMTTRGRWPKTTKTRGEPRFAIELWNLHSRLNDCLPRTNNFCETWHNAFSSMLRSHPSVYSLVDAFRGEQKKTEDQLVALKTGVVGQRKVKYIMLDERIAEIMKDYAGPDSFYSIFDALSLIM